MKTNLFIAQVGAHKKRTDGDIGRWMIAVHWLLARNLRFTAKFDTINLRYGRDFLQEIEEYDVVVLHDIFDALGPDLLHYPTLKKNLPDRIWQSIQVSPLQSILRWRHRLVQTNAQFIFVFETSVGCINGWMLGELEGYTIIFQDQFQTVYERKEPKNAVHRVAGTKVGKKNGKRGKAQPEEIFPVSERTHSG